MGVQQEQVPEQWLVAAGGALLGPLLIVERLELILPLYAIVFLLLAFFFLARLPELAEVMRRLGWFACGLIYLPILLGHLIPLRMLADGKKWIFMVLIAVMLCDSMAYFVGRKLGRRKLYPAVSPNKSIEGAIGGLVGSVVGVLFSASFFLPVIGWADGILIGLLLGVFGQVGDLFESLLKRACQVKDSGSLIPGHGGLLDRLDSLLFAFPLVYYIARYCYGG